MKKLFIALLLMISAVTTYAQPNSDSLAYQLQRKKINAMLDVRTKKFSQYDESLSQHTGIFGLQTKKDIRRSNDILMDIVSADNEIFQQLKILLDYRTFQQTQVQSQSQEAGDKALAYMTTINKLRDELEKVNNQAAADERSNDRMKIILYSIIGILFLSILYYITRKTAAK